MSFWGKIAKISSIAMMASGGAVVVGSAAMLGVGTNYTYSQEIEGKEYKVGVGSMNYNKSWLDGELVPNESSSTIKSYSDFIKEMNDSRKLADEYLESLPEGPEKETAKKTLEVYYAVDTAYGLMIAGADRKSVV